MENKFPGENGAWCFPGKTPLGKANPQKAIATPLRPIDNTYYKESEKGNQLQQSTPPNVCPSLEVKTSISRNTPTQPQGRYVRLSAEKDLAHKEKHHVKMKAMPMPILCKTVLFL